MTVLEKVGCFYCMIIIYEAYKHYVYLIVRLDVFFGIFKWSLYHIERQIGFSIFLCERKLNSGLMDYKQWL